MTFQPKFYHNKYGELAMTYDDFESLTEAQKDEIERNFWRFSDYTEGGYCFKEMTDAEKALFLLKGVKAMEKAEQIKKAMEIVEKQEALRASYVAAKTKAEKEEALSAYRTLSGVILTKYDRDVCGLAWCERNRLEYGNELLDIEETCNIEELMGIFKIAGVKKFTVSISMSLMEILATLNKLGVEPKSMTRIYTHYIDCEGNREMVDAVVMEIKEEV